MALPHSPLGLGAAGKKTSVFNSQEASGFSKEEVEGRKFQGFALIKSHPKGPVERVGQEPILDLSVSPWWFWGLGRILPCGELLGRGEV